MILSLREATNRHLDLVKTGLRFSVVGVVASLVHVGSAIGLRATFAMDPVKASNLGFCAAFLFSFIGHYKYSFSKKEFCKYYFIKFLILSCLSFLMSMFIVWFGVEKIQLNSDIATISLIAIIPFFNFFVSKFWVFKTIQ